MRSSDNAGNFTRTVSGKLVSLLLRYHQLPLICNGNRTERSTIQGVIG